DRLPETLLSDQLPPQANNEEHLFEERLRDRLVSLGLQEVITYALTVPERESLLGHAVSEGEYVKILNPISSERTVMRRLLLAGVLEAAQRNLQHTGDVRLFEIGSVYLPRTGEKLPAEP